MKIFINGIIYKTCFLFLIFCFSISYGQKVVSGIILDEKTRSMSNVLVQIVELESKKTLTDDQGFFSLELPVGKWTLSISYTGYKKAIKQIVVDANDIQKIEIYLKPEVNSLEEVVIKTKNKADLIKQKAFEIEVVEIKDQKNSSVDINSVLAKIPGVNIRQSGGLGSSFEFSLNGLSGKKVKFFVDEIPLENYGSSLGLNNFPATLIERVEVFKGVSPIYLGADALGGAVNIITKSTKESFIDASYDYGSFNTHRFTLNFQQVLARDWVLKLASFYNYSDNNYTIDNVTIRDDLGNDTGAVANNVERFHDAYDSQMIQMQTGVVGKRFADELLLGIQVSANKNEIQHSAASSEKPFGEVFTENETFKSFVTFKKDNLLDKKLKLKFYASYGINNEKVVDTASREYDWFGGYTESVNQSMGELESSKTLFKFKDNLHLINASSDYQLNEISSVSINYTKNYIKRVGEDPYSTTKIAFSEPHILDKHILGLAYNLNWFENRLNTEIFTKGFLIKSKGISEDLFSGVQTKYDKTLEEIGYGLATTYKFSEQLRAKSSFERTFRAPDGYELFGDGYLLVANVDLLPEDSYNLNMGLIYNTQISNSVQFNFDTNLFLRKSNNFIYLLSEGGITKNYENASKVNSIGGELEIQSVFYKRISLSTNVTYQSITRDEDNSRISNIPYLFGNLNLAYRFPKVFTSEDPLNVSWNSYYVEEFPLVSYTAGNDDRSVVDQQISHNLEAAYSLKKGKYNISFLVKNITDAQLYDNFQIQQPGRAYYFKIRYNINN